MSINKQILTSLFALQLVFLCLSAQAMEAPKAFEITAGAHAKQGPRPTMEDEHIIVPTEKFGHFYSGVYDGHGGENVAKMLVAGESTLHKSIFDNMKTGMTIEEAVKKSYIDFDTFLYNNYKQCFMLQGSTAVSAIISDGDLYIANIGDAEASIINNDGSAPVNMTYTHRASDAKEKERIEALGGNIFMNRVLGALAVTRAFGDFDFKKPKKPGNFVECEPFIKRIHLERQHKFVILACDGLWDVMKHQKVSDFVLERSKNGDNAEAIAKALVDKALNRKSQDNVSVVVIQIHWQPR